MPVKTTVLVPSAYPSGWKGEGLYDIASYDANLCAVSPIAPCSPPDIMPLMSISYGSGERML